MKLNITDMALDDRPREKFMTKGVEGMTTSELLAILIGTGSRDENAVGLMQRILNDCDGSLITLGKRSIAELCQYHGVGPAKAVSILAACEVGARRSSEQNRKEFITTAEDIYHYYKHQLQNLCHEESHVLLLSQRLQVIASRLISKGGLTGTVVDVRLILKEALLANAPNIALVHNHPSGNRKPSREDDSLTERVRQAANTMNIHLIDHVIVASEGYYSYQEAGKL